MIDLPTDLKPQSVSLTLASNTKVYESTFNKSISTSKFAGDRWLLTLSYGALDTGVLDTADEAGRLSAILFSLGGRSGKLRVPMYHRMGDVAKGTPVINGNGQSGGLLATNGWDVSTTVLKQGDFITVNDELKMVLADVVSDVSGNATLQFTPWLRSTVYNGDAIQTQNPTGVFMLSDDEVGFDYEPMNSSVTLELQEAFYV